MNPYSKKIKQFLKNQKSKKFYSSRKHIAKHVGLSTQHLYSRLCKHNWKRSEVYALGKIIDLKICDTDEQVTEKVLKFILDQKKKRKEGIWTRGKMAKHLGMSLSLLYQRFDNGNWKDDEILKIEKL